MKRVPLCIAFSLCLLWVGIANAEPPQLKGQYAFTGTEGGLLTAGSFDSSLSSPDAYGFFSSEQGIATFNGDGTGTVTGTGVGNTAPPPSGSDMSAWSEDFSFNFTYTVDKSGQISMNLVPGSYSGTFTAGVRAGETYELTQLSLAGMASKNNSVLTLTTETPDVVEVDYYSGGNLAATRSKIGHYSLVFTWLGNNQGQNSHK